MQLKSNKRKLINDIWKRLRDYDERSCLANELVKATERLELSISTASRYGVSAERAVRLLSILRAFTELCLGKPQKLKLKVEAASDEVNANVMKQRNLDFSDF